MEQIFLNDKCRFYARVSKGDKPQMIYFNAQVGGERFVISTNVKVKPNQFNVKKQHAVVSNEQCELDNRNNAIVNETIKHYTAKWREYLSWLGKNPDGISEAKKNIYNFVPMKTKAKGGNGNAKKFNETLEYIFGKQIEYEVEKHIIEELRAKVKRSNIKVFIEFMSVFNIPDSWSSLTLKTYNEYSAWLVSRSLNVSTTNAYLSTLKSVVNGICKHDESREPIDTRRWELVKKNITTSESKSANRVFTDDQLRSIMELELDGTAEIIRDIFVFGCFTGQRPADNVRLLKGEGKRFNSNGIEVISLLPHKTRKTDKVAFVPIFNTEAVDRIIEKFKTEPSYIEYLNKTDTQRNTLNSKHIKRIFEQAGLNDSYEVTRQKGYDAVNETKSQSQTAHAYLSRHYFITYMCRNGVSENEVIEMTGHTSTKQIHDTYAHLTAEQQADKLTARASIQALAGNTAPQTHTTDDLNRIVMELKSMLSRNTSSDDSIIKWFAQQRGVSVAEIEQALADGTL